MQASLGEFLRCGLAVTVLAIVAVPTIPALAGDLCATYDLQGDWSEEANPNGTWSYREEANLLPHVEAWQRTIGGWTEFQPGWAESEDGNNRLPFWYQSNGTETFENDLVEDDIVVHTHDGVNGAGNGQAEAVWTSPFDGVVTLSGNVWMGREIGRSASWALLHDATELSKGDIGSGDVYSRATPFDFSTGSGGASAIVGLPVATGDEIRLRMVTTSGSGDFIGVRFSVDCVSLTGSTSTTLPPRDCGDPLFVFMPAAGDSGTAATINASDSLYTLRAAVGSVSCELCVCDVNDSGVITASDSLAILKKAVGGDTALNCPDC